MKIVRIADHPLGIGVYVYEISGQSTIGVMADEVEPLVPEAVLTRADGFKMVNYGHPKICGEPAVGYGMINADGYANG